MSYCRRSTDDLKCDLYVYQDVNRGFTAVVAAALYLDGRPREPLSRRPVISRETDRANARSMKSRPIIDRMLEAALVLFIALSGGFMFGTSINVPAIASAAAQLSPYDPIAVRSAAAVVGVLMMALAVGRIATMKFERLPFWPALTFALGIASVAATAFCPPAGSSWQLISAARAAEHRVIIIDGDTVDIDGERIRILNIDAPETRGSRCEQELILGLRAKERLAQLLRAGAVRVDRCEASGRCTDRYGRTLARLGTSAGDVGQILITEGLALPWRPGRDAAEQRIAVWCPR